MGFGLSFGSCGCRAGGTAPFQSNGDWERNYARVTGTGFFWIEWNIERLSDPRYDVNRWKPANTGGPRTWSGAQLYRDIAEQYKAVGGYLPDHVWPLNDSNFHMTSFWNGGAYDYVPWNSLRAFHFELICDPWVAKMGLWKLKFVAKPMTTVPPGVRTPGGLAPFINEEFVLDEPIKRFERSTGSVDVVASLIVPNYATGGDVIFGGGIDALFPPAEDLVGPTKVILRAYY